MNSFENEHNKSFLIKNWSKLIQNWHGHLIGIWFWRQILNWTDFVFYNGRNPILNRWRFNSGWLMPKLTKMIFFSVRRTQNWVSRVWRQTPISKPKTPEINTKARIGQLLRGGGGGTVGRNYKCCAMNISGVKILLAYSTKQIESSDWLDCHGT